jgi:two-component system sensor histidine kinase/response regulator
MLTANPSTILIVDDQPTNLKMLFSFLQESGFKVLVAKTGESAIQKLRTISPDLILLDVMMPGLDGFETCLRLKSSAESKDIPVIFITALSESMDKIKGLKVGAVDYITKPFQQEEVLARIENQLKIRRLSQQLEDQNQQLQREISTRQKIEERLKLVIQAANDGFWDWNLESGEIYISPRCKEMLGYSDEELPNEFSSLENHVFPDDRIAALKLLEDYNSGKLTRFESVQRFRHKNGSTVHILVRCLHLKDAKGQVSRMVGAYTDITEITKATEALLMTQKRLEYLLSSSPSVIFSCKTTFPYANTFISQNISDLFGYEPGEFLEDESFWVNHIHPDDTERIFAELPQLLKVGHHSFEYRFLHKDGTYRWILVACKLGHDEVGNPLEIIGSMSDITKRKQVEAALQESQRWLSAITEANPNIVYVYDLIEQRNAYINREVYTILGYTPEEVQQMGIAVLQTLMHPDDFAAVAEHFKRFESAQEGEIIEFEYRMKYKNGGWCWLFAWETVFTRNTNGKPKQILGTAADISDRKRAEAALQASEAELRCLFAAMTDLVFAIDAQGRYLKIAQTNPSLLCEPAEVLLGKTLHEVFPPSQADLFLNCIRNTLETQETQDIEYSLTVQGSKVWFSTKVSPLSPDSVIWVARDISDRKRIEDALRQSEERFQLALSGSALGLWDWNISTRKIYFSPPWKTMLGYEVEEIENSYHSLERLIHPEDLPRLLAAINAHFEGRSPLYEEEFRMLSKQGEWKWILSRGKLMERDESGNPVRMTGTHKDISDRKAIEIALQQSQARLQNLAANVPGMLYEFLRYSDGSFGFAYVSSGCRDIIELEPEQIVENSAPVFEQVHPDDEQSLYDSLEASSQTLEAWAWEGRIITPSGKLKWIQGAARPEHCDNGEILWHGLTIDVSDRVLVQESLRESEERFRSMADSTAVLLWMSGTEGHYTFFNKTWLEFTGRTLEEELSIGWMDKVYPDDRQRCMETYLPAFETRENFEIEYRLLRFDGEYRWIVDLGKPRFTPNGSFAGYIGSCIDITERKQTELEIKTAKIALERQIQRVLLQERITQEIRSSLKSEQIFQTAANQIGQTFSVNRCVIHTYITQPVPRIPVVAEYLEPGYSSMIEVEIPVIGNAHAQLMLSQDKAVKSDDVYNDPLLAEIPDLLRQLGLKSLVVIRTSYQGKPNGVIGLLQCARFRHWTEEETNLLEAVAVQMGIAIAQANLLEQEKQQRRELALQNHALEKAKLEAEAANHAKSQFLSKMSHELRTPLNAILGFTQVMASDKSLTREHKEYLGIINRSGEHLLELINDILSMSKIEAGQVTLNPSRFDLYRLLDSLEEMLQFKATSKRLDLIFEQTPDVPRYIQADDSKLRQVLINLLGNAIKFTQTGRVTLRVRVGEPENSPTFFPGRRSNLHPVTPSPRLWFEVEDTGPGIAPEELGTLFDPFVQTETGRQSMEGTGLGLPISQQFIRMMGGELAVSSTLGQGTIFMFDIQIGLATSADEKPITGKRRVIALEPNQPSYRILVVEDAAVNRKLLVKILEPLGFEVRTATNGQEGVALWESWSPHLIWMDVIMPIMDGYEATRQIKQTPKGQNTIIIALTASAFEEQQEAILSTGCDDFLPKPFQREVLLEKIAHHLGVCYVYEQQGTPALPQSSPPVQPLTQEDLAVMPASWVIQLHQAALWADDELMKQLIEQIPREYASLRRELRALIDNFLLEQIINLTQSARS